MLPTEVINRRRRFEVVGDGIYVDIHIEVYNRCVLMDGGPIAICRVAAITHMMMMIMIISMIISWIAASVEVELRYVDGCSDSNYLM